MGFQKARNEEAGSQISGDQLVLVFYSHDSGCSEATKKSKEACVGFWGPFSSYYSEV
jgi:hypothetical protein